MPHSWGEPGVIGSIDSNVRRRNIEISPNFNNGNVICVYNNVPSVFMANRTPSGAEKHRESTESKSYGGPGGHAMRRYLSADGDVTVDDDDVTLAM